MRKHKHSGIVGGGGLEDPERLISHDAGVTQRVSAQPLSLISLLLTLVPQIPAVFFDFRLKEKDHL